VPKRPKQVLIVDQLLRNDRGKVLRDRLRAEWVDRARLPA
jgi:acyl-CoA synthetase (AMP-forming)/AMP-acid ligase II